MEEFFTDTEVCFGCEAEKDLRHIYWCSMCHESFCKVCIGDFKAVVCKDCEPYYEPYRPSDEEW